MPPSRFRSHFHWPLFWILIVLMLVAILNLHSATYDLERGGVSSLVWNQLLVISFSFVLALLLLLVDYRVFMRFTYPYYFFCLLLLLGVVFFGKTVHGNRSWLALGPLTFQPSEFAKLAVVLALARYFSDHPPRKWMYQFWELIPPLALLVAPVVLVALGGDMGSAFFLVLLTGSIFLFSGIQKRIVLILFAFLLLCGGVSYTFVLSSHQRSRVQAFLNPGEDPRGQGYHLLQSKIAVGSGRLLGKGYLRGMHNKLLYLPEKHTDFIFPVWAEEWGFLGSLLLLGLYAAVLLSGLQIASRAKERFGVYLGFGVTAIFFWQIAINLGGVLGMIPLTGVTLPLLSYGGSSIVTLLFGVSLLFNISMRRFMF